MLKEINDLNLVNDLSEYKVSFNQFNKVLGFFINSNLVGFLDYSIIYDRLEVNYIFVKEEYRRKNIAYTLLKYIIDNYNFVNITLEVNINNNKAINLYQKLGFKIIAIRPKYYNGIDGYLMERRVS